jgi:hypothetical protein
MGLAHRPLAFWEGTDPDKIEFHVRRYLSERRDATTAELGMLNLDNETFVSSVMSNKVQKWYIQGQ